MIKLYNTLTRKKDVFKSINKGKVGMYSCGPTVYWYQHIGNLRTYIFSDVLRRVLEYNRYNVKHVINVTDVGHLTSDSDYGEDKMENAVLREGKTAKEISNFYFNEFEKDLKKLNIEMPWKWSWATKNIKEQIELVKKLEEKGFTYQLDDGIYFDSSKFKDYANFAKLNVEGLKAGKRVNFVGKKNKTDFALWKFSVNRGERQQEWESPWGLGFPGWHLECSAMSMKYLGNHSDSGNKKFPDSIITKKGQAIIDIHTGGEDHIPVHHTNEIAQSESATGKKFVNYWLHGAFLLNKGEKVSKSKGGLYTLSELEEIGYSPNVFRYLVLLTHYRKPLNFSLKQMDFAKSAFNKIKRKIVELKKERHKGVDNSKIYEKEFLEAVNNDLNIPRAIQIFLKVLDDFDFDSSKKLKLLKMFDKVLGLGFDKIGEEKIEVPSEVKKLIDKREKLRKEKKWAEADILRGRILENGFKLEDISGNVKVEKI